MEKAWHKKVIELKSVRLANLSFIKLKKLNLIYLRIDNMTALSYLVNMGGIQNKHLIEILKKLGLSHREVNIFDSLSNQTTGWKFQNFQSSSKWKLCPTIFKQICSHLVKPLLDLLASKLWHQLPRYIA